MSSSTILSLAGAGGRAAAVATRRSHLRRLSSTTAARCPAGLDPPDVARLAESARITLSPDEVEEFGPKIRQVVEWFGQLQAVDLGSIEPSLRADTELTANPREDLPEIFENRDAILAAVPSFDDPYIKVPKVINKE